MEIFLFSPLAYKNSINPAEEKTVKINREKKRWEKEEDTGEIIKKNIKMSTLLFVLLLT